jgi:ubiquinone/menaquinone biosynthesis C-methylase UbiE
MYPLERLGQIKLPEGYEASLDNLKVIGDTGIRTDFLPDNHPFSHYDEIFHGLLSAYLQKHPYSKFLDVGGGFESVAVQGLMAEFPDVTAVNVDLFAENTEYSRQGNADSLPIDDSSIDLVVSVNCVSRFLMSFHFQGRTMVEEIVRVLKPGGLSFVSPGFDLTPLSSGLEAVTQLYGQNPYSGVYRKVGTPLTS